MEEILKCIRSSLSSVDHPRYFDTERGFQGALSNEINIRLPRLELRGAIIEEEYQKRIKEHGFVIRPDIIIHIPYDYSELEARDQGNFVVIELKRQATEQDALEDFRKLSKMCDALKYPLGVFINIASDSSFLSKFDKKDDPRIHSFAVKLENKKVYIVED